MEVFPTGGPHPFATGLNGPDGLAYGPDNYLYVANYGGNTVSQLGTNGNPTFASGLDGPTGLAFDNNGNLYVANGLDGVLDRVTPGGVVTAFATLAQNDAPSGIAYGPDGNLYVACSGSDRIAQISPAGAVAYLTPSGLGEPVFLVAVPEPGGLALIGSTIAFASVAHRWTSGAPAKAVNGRRTGRRVTAVPDSALCGSHTAKRQFFRATNGGYGGGRDRY